MCTRCHWAKSEIEQEYHDKEWGKPLFDNQLLFEFLCLEGMQAGLSWITILKKRDAFRQAFYNFDPVKVAKMTEEDVEKLLQNEAIIRSERKIRGVIQNAKAFLEVEKELGSFSKFLWSFVNHEPIVNNFETPQEVPAKTDLSEQMSKVLKKRGFTFVGPVICYSFMQATGMVNDHLLSCDFR